MSYSNGRILDLDDLYLTTYETTYEYNLTSISVINHEEHNDYFGGNYDCATNNANGDNTRHLSSTNRLRLATRKNATDLGLNTITPPPDKQQPLDH